LKETQDQLEKARIRTLEIERNHKDDETASQWQEKVSTLQTELNDARASFKNTMEQLQSLKASMKEVEKDKCSALDVVADSARRITELERVLEDTRRELEARRESTGSLQEEEATMLRDRIAVLESREEELTIVIENKDATEEELKQCRQDCEHLACDLEEVQGQLTRVKEEASRAEGQWSEERLGLEAKLQSVLEEKAESDALLEELAGENEGLVQTLEGTKAELQTTLEEVEKLNEKMVLLEKELDLECNARREVEQRLRHALEESAGHESRAASLHDELTASNSKIIELSHQLATVTAHLQQAKAEISNLQSQLHAKQHYCDNFEKTERELLQDNHRLNEIRRSLHNRVIQLSGNIRVFVRVRPALESEMPALTNGPAETVSRPSSRNGPGSRPSSRDGRRTSTSIPQKKEVPTDISPFHFPEITAERSAKNGLSSYSDLTKQTIEIIEPYKDRGGLNPRQKRWKYGFDRVYTPSQTQDDIWEGAEPLVQSCLDGFNVCMFAYGQVSDVFFWFYLLSLLDVVD
jgi:kinesin family protein C1